MNPAEMTMTPNTPLSHPKYRPDIDGLRAIAVLSVVAFHAFPTSMKGGFIGVDVFFVISGFLISTIICENLDRGTFRFTEFYARRIKRIFPALIVVLIACMIFAWYSLLPDELNQLGKHIAAGAGFISNFVFWSESGYFDRAAEEKPLLHLWSLGIEEQFYIAWPLLLWYIRKTRINPIIITTLLLLGSFLTNIWLVRSDPVAVFYSPLTRFWELLCGSLLALYSLNISKARSLKSDFAATEDRPSARVDAKKDRQSASSNLLAFMGISSLIAGFYLIDKETEFPGYWALMPALGSTMVILAGEKAWINRTILSSRILVWFGLISFPLYLWHWPLLSFGRIIYFETPPLGFRILAIALSIGLAWLTMQLVERPIRFSRNFPSLKISGLVGSMLVISSLGTALFLANFERSHGLESLSIKRRGEHAIGSSLAWYRGKEDWLFLGNSYDNSVEKLKLAKKPSEQQLQETKSAFSKISDIAQQLGMRTFLIIGPNKSSIYPEFLPDSIKPSAVKYSSYFLEKLREIPSLTVYDPTTELLAAKDAEGLLYWKTDTHWNNKGAFLTFNGFTKLLKLHPPELSFKHGGTHSGDLLEISKLKDFPLDHRDNWEIVWKEQPAWTEQATPNEQKTTFGIASSVQNKKPLSEQYVWVVGDSFTETLRPYFNATFHKVRYVGHWSKKLDTLPNEMLSAEARPDLIIIVRVERSF